MIGETFKVGDYVSKVGGRYGGPGQIVGETIELDDKGHKLWNVAMRVEGGYGQFVHVFPSSALTGREPTPPELGWQFYCYNGHDRWDWPRWLKSHPRSAYARDWGRARDEQHISASEPYLYAPGMRADVGDWIALAPDGTLVTLTAVPDSAEWDRMRDEARVARAFVSAVFDQAGRRPPPGADGTEQSWPADMFEVERLTRKVVSRWAQPLRDDTMKPTVFRLDHVATIAKLHAICSEYEQSCGASPNPVEAMDAVRRALGRLVDNAGPS